MEIKTGNEDQNFYKTINAEIEEEEELAREIIGEVTGEVNEKFPKSVGFIIGNEFCER